MAGASEFELPTIRVATLFMEARVAAGELVLSSEHESHAWVPRDEVAGMDLADQLREFVDTYVA